MTNAWSKTDEKWQFVFSHWQMEMRRVWCRFWIMVFWPRSWTFWFIYSRFFTYLSQFSDDIMNRTWQLLDTNVEIIGKDQRTNFGNFSLTVIRNVTILDYDPLRRTRYVWFWNISQLCSTCSWSNWWKVVDIFFLLRIKSFLINWNIELQVFYCWIKRQSLCRITTCVKRWNVIWK